MSIICNITERRCRGYRAWFISTVINTFVDDAIARGSDTSNILIPI